MSINVGEVGYTIYVDAGIDISQATNIEIILEPQIGDKKTVSATLGTVDVGNYTANEYATYTTVSADDIDQAGRWRKKLVATFADGNNHITNYDRFTVMP